MQKDSTAHETGQPNDRIYAEPAHFLQQVNAEAATASAIYDQHAHAPLVQMCNKVVNDEKIKNENEYARRDKLTGDVERCTKTELRLLYPGAYVSWRGIKRRCKLDDGVLHPAFKEWPDFLLAVGPRPDPTHTIDRIDHINPEYSPENTRWASKPLQTANRRTTKLYSDSQGNSYTIAEWSRITSLKQTTIRGRLDRGKSVDQAMYTALRAFPHQAPAEPEGAGTKRFIDIWKRVLKETHGHGFFSPTGKEVGLLKVIFQRFADGGVYPDKALEHVLTEWSDFVFYAKHTYAAWQERPEVPTVAYLMQNLQAAGNFYLDSRKPKRKEKSPVLGWIPLPKSFCSDDTPSD